MLHNHGFILSKKNDFTRIKLKQIVYKFKKIYFVATYFLLSNRSFDWWIKKTLSENSIRLTTDNNFLEMIIAILSFEHFSYTQHAAYGLQIKKVVFWQTLRNLFVSL